MMYRIHDSSNATTSICAAIEEAIEQVETALRRQEAKGSKVKREEMGRWLIHDGQNTDLVWIEDEQGTVISFARRGARSAEPATV